jgi:hypothetical protein
MAWSEPKAGTSEPKPSPSFPRFLASGLPYWQMLVQDEMPTFWSAHTWKQASCEEPLPQVRQGWVETPQIDRQLETPTFWALQAW